MTTSVVELEVFTDINNDGLMSWGEEIDDILVYITTRDQRWSTEAYTVGGKVKIPLNGAPDEELVIIIPYLHRSAELKLNEGIIKTQVDLNTTILPSYLP